MDVVIYIGKAEPSAAELCDLGLTSRFSAHLVSVCKACVYSRTEDVLESPYPLAGCNAHASEGWTQTEVLPWGRLSCPPMPGLKLRDGTEETFFLQCTIKEPPLLQNVSQLSPRIVSKNNHHILYLWWGQKLSHMVATFWSFTSTVQSSKKHRLLKWSGNI